MKLRCFARVRTPAVVVGLAKVLPPDEPDETCWLASDDWWLSTVAVPDGDR
jgi:hypothetical protein